LPFFLAGQGVKSLIEAYNLLQEAFNHTNDADAIDSCGSDLYVLCAELCFKVRIDLSDLTFIV